MKTYLLSFITLTILFSSVIAQDKSETVQIGKKKSMQQTVNLGKLGFILKYGGGSEYLMRYYTPSFEMKWEAPLIVTNVSNDYPVVVSCDGNYTYQYGYKGLRQGTMIISQIDNTGKTKTSENKIDLLYKKITFCDNKYLYFLSTEKGNELDKKKTEEKLILNKFEHSNLAYTKSIVDLPKIKDPDITTFWTYTGHYNNEIYLASKKLDEKNGKFIYYIISVNSDGKTLKNITLDIPFSNKYVRPSRNIKNYYGTFSGGDDDFSMESRGPNSSGFKMMPRLEAFSNIIIDKDNNAIYVYGLYGLRPFKNGEDIKGYFINKFDMAGNTVFNIQKESSKELAADKYFSGNQPRAYSLNLLLTPNADQSITFRIWYRDQMHTFSFTNKGELIQYVNNKYDKFISYDDVSYNISPNEIEYFNSKAAQSKFNNYKKTVGEKILKKAKFEFFHLNDGEIVIEDETKDADLVKLLFFSNK